METKEMVISVPDGYEIDVEKSSFTRILFKKIGRWRDDVTKKVNGYFIGINGDLIYTKGQSQKTSHNLYTTESIANSAKAMAKISQIMANDKRFGGPITYEEWEDKSIYKFSIIRVYNHIAMYASENLVQIFHFLSFHTREQRDLFLNENEDLVKEYLMIK